MFKFGDLETLGAPFRNAEVQVSLRKQAARVVIEIETASEMEGQGLQAYLDLTLTPPPDCTLSDSYFNDCREDTVNCGLDILQALKECGLLASNCFFRIVSVDSLPETQGEHSLKLCA